MGKRWPTSIFEFQEMFPDDQACWEYIVKTRWPNGFVCPKCGGGRKLFRKERRLWRCENGHEISVTTDTVMHRTKIPLCNWLWAAYLTVTKTLGMSALQLARQLGMRFETTFMMLHKLRTAMVAPGRTKLKGTVEIDESYVGGRKRGGKRGRGAEGKALVVGAVEIIRYQDEKGKWHKIAGRLRMRKVKDASGETLFKFIGDNIEPGTRLMTDGWKGYDGIEKHGYDRYAVKGANSVEVAKGLPKIHIVFGNLKTWLNGTHHGVSRKHIQTYLNEFCFRFSRRHNPMAAFNRVLGIAANQEGPEYEEIYAPEKSDERWEYVNLLWDEDDAA